MKFQPGDLVTFKDQSTQVGNFTDATAMLVLKTKVTPYELSPAFDPDTQMVFVHHLKRGLQGWDFAHAYVKIPSSPTKLS